MSEVVNDSWDDIVLTDVTESESEADESTEADQPKEDKAEETAEKSAPESFLHIKHLDEEKDLTREEAIVYAQKGADYDRIRGKLDEQNKELEELRGLKGEAENLKDRLSILEELAEASGMTVDEMLLDTKASQMARKTGKDKEVCKGIIQNEMEAKRLEKLSKTEQTSKMDSDINDFVSEYPEVTDFSKIDKSVWEDVSKGMTLSKAYAKWEKNQLIAENNRLKAEAEAEKQKSENKLRSTGSQSTESNKDRDPFEDLWYDGR